MSEFDDHSQEPYGRLGIVSSAEERTRKINETAAFIRGRLPTGEYQNPCVSIICGSGLSFLGKLLQHTVEIQYEDIPHFPKSSVKGHGKKVIVGILNDVVVICLLGRFHIYEGHSLEDIALPIYVLAAMKVKNLIVTNSAGALNDSFNVGDIMVIEDHISFVGLSGLNPLRGENLDEYGTRFPSMNTPYYEHSFDIASEANCPVGKCSLRRGVYVGVGGPTFETRAEVRFLSLIGGDAVGMSTTPEVICANHASLRVVGLSLITNIQRSYTAPTHKEVLAVSDEYSERVQRIVSHIITTLGGITTDC